MARQLAGIIGKNGGQGQGEFERDFKPGKGRKMGKGTTGHADGP
jgi:hypothetical protein